MEIDDKKKHVETFSNISAPHGHHHERMHGGGLDERKEGIVPKNINDLVAKSQNNDLHRHRLVAFHILIFYMTNYT